MKSPSWRLVTVDIDGTLTTVHGWLALAREFGREADYLALMRRFRSGAADEDTTLAELLEFAEGRSLEEVERVVARTPKLAEIPEGVARLRRAGLHVALLTHNPPYVTGWYCRFGGFEAAAGLAGTQPVGFLIGPARGIRADKWGGVRELCSRFDCRPSEVVHVGDAPADAAVFPRIGYGISLNARLPTVERAADLVLRTHDFEEVVDVVLGERSPG